MAARRKLREAPTEQDIYERIFGAILERRLQPGARLGEDRLGRMFGVSRTKVRLALAKLAQDGVVEMRRNRGASIAAPTRTLARQVFELRYILEPAIAGQLAERHEPKELAILRRHAAKEAAARSTGDDAALIRLTGEFHLIIADLVANPLVVRLLKGMEALTCLAILSYARTDSSACLPHEHTEILAAIAARDADRSRRLMLHHLEHVAAGLLLEELRPPAHDLSRVLGLGQPARAARAIRRRTRA
jgi:DNA-binding GntR family transcriptional regulator